MQLATEESQDLSQVDEEVEDDDEHEEGSTTLYFDAESGTLYAAPGVEIQDEETEEQGEVADERTSTQAARGATQTTQRPITSRNERLPPLTID